MEMPNKPFVLLEVRQDQLPVRRRQVHELAAVELLFHGGLVRIPQVDGATRGQGEEVRPRVRAFPGERSCRSIEFEAVQHDEAAAVEGIAGHEGFGQVIEAGAVDHHPGPPDGVDQRPAGRIAQDVDLAPLGAVHEGLADVAVDDQLAALHDLPQLVLGVAVDMDLETVDARGQVVARAVVNIDAHTVGIVQQAAAGEALPLVPVTEKLAPPILYAAQINRASQSSPSGGNSLAFTTSIFSGSCGGRSASRVYQSIWR